MRPAARCPHNQGVAGLSVALESICPFCDANKELGVAAWIAHAVLRKECARRGGGAANARFKDTHLVERFGKPAVLHSLPYLLDETAFTLHAFPLSCLQDADVALQGRSLP